MFFILGSPRSGTSMLRMMLNTHSEMVVPPECGFALWLYERFSKTDFILDLQARDIFVDALLSSRKFETWGVSKASITITINDRNPRSYQEICECVYFCFGETSGKSGKIFGDKNNYYVSELSLLKQVFPESKYVCIVRDGRDVASSYLEINRKSISSKYAPNLPTSITDIAKEWNDNNVIIFDEIQKGCFFVKYEDLVQNPGVNLSRICEFLNLKYEPSMLDFYKIKNGAEPKDFLQWKGMTQEKVSETSIKRYLNDLTKNEILLFEKEARVSLKNFGYL